MYFLPYFNSVRLKILNLVTNFKWINEAKRNMRILKFLFILLMVPVYGQELYNINNIPEPLRTNANAVYRVLNTVIELDAVDRMTITEHVVLTVFNKNGLSALKPVAYYDNSSSIQAISANVFDKNGKQIKKFKKKNFVDVSVTGTNLYTDNRALVLEYTPPFYPFTFEFLVETRSKSTGFLPPWDPSPYYRVSTESSSYIVRNPNVIPLTVRAFNLEDFDVRFTETNTLKKYSVKNLKAIDREPLGPHYTEFTPVVKIAPLKFELEGKEANISSWKDFGLWQDQQLLKGRRELPQSTIAKVTEIVRGVVDKKEKTRLIYEFMQSKTRYISVQVGIGGWQPTLAMEVDQLGYGDCKGLTNYTMALLESQGIESYYTIVNAGSEGRDLDENFLALQGNHVILTVPFEDEKVFLECTSQDVPFNYLGEHTDNRKVLMITPEGGIMGHTHEYSASDNMQDLKGEISLEPSLLVKGEIVQSSSGIQYSYRYHLKDAKAVEKDASYKKTWSHLNDLRVDQIEFSNDKENIVFQESLRFQTAGYCSRAGDRILLNPNLFRRIENIPIKTEKRTQPVVIKRGYTERDVIRWSIPENFLMESIFEPFELNSPFGSYKVELVKEANNFIYTREFKINSGRYPKETFNEYVDFIKEVAKRDRSKIVLSKK